MLNNSQILLLHRQSRCYVVSINKQWQNHVCISLCEHMVSSVSRRAEGLLIPGCAKSLLTRWYPQVRMSSPIPKCVSSPVSKFCTSAPRRKSPVASFATLSLSLTRRTSAACLPSCVTLCGHVSKVWPRCHCWEGMNQMLQNSRQYTPVSTRSLVSMLYRLSETNGLMSRS